MRVVAKKNGKFKIVGLKRSVLVILKETLEYIDEDLVCKELPHFEPEKISAVLDLLHSLIFESLGDYY